MNLTDVSKKTDAQLKNEIRVNLAKKRAQEIDEIRLKNLKAEVEVEEMWDFYDSDKKYRENLKRWLNEWANGSYLTYLEKVNNWELPMVQIQCFDSPDLYEICIKPNSSSGYRRKKDQEDEERDNRRSAFITVGCLLGFAIIFGLLLLWLI